jgi:hypothetical protein
MMKTGLANMAIGVGLAAIGIVITAVTYSAASHGGTYVVAWGAMAVGAWRFLLGVFQALRGSVGGHTAPVEASWSPSSPAAGGLAPASPIGGASGELPAPMLAIGVLLLVQAVVRSGFLVNLLLQARSDFFTYPKFLMLSVIVPAVLAVGGVIAGILALTRSEMARGFGLAFCAVGLLFQLYGALNVAMLAMNQAAFHVPWYTLVLIPGNIAVYIAGLVIFGGAPSYKSQY